MALSVNSQFLYVQTGGGVSVAIFEVDGGALTLIGTTEGLPFGAQGIAAK
jgi:hypothetical protein